MNNFNYFHPTEIMFGCSRINKIGETIARFGKRCLLVTEKPFDVILANIEKVKETLKKSNIEFEHFDGAVPNPTTSISKGASIAKKIKSDVILGISGDSSMDTAKAIAVEATHEEIAWNYTIFNSKHVSEKTLPIVAVTTTSGTGANLTQVAIFTNPDEKFKSAIVSPFVFPRVTIIDPDLMLTVPSHVTVSTGFDAFCHAFESYLHRM